MKKVLLLLLGFVVFLSAKTIVTVNGQAITDEIVPGYDKLDKQKQEAVKQQLINEELLMSYALKSDVIKDKNFKKVFEAQKAQIEKAYKAKMKKSLSKEQIRNIKGSVAVQAMLAKKARSMKISDKDAKDYYTKNIDKFKMPEAVEIAALADKDKKKAEAMLKELKKSKDIPSAIMKIAKKKKQRGYLGWLPQNAFPADVFKKIYSSKANHLIKEPIEVNGIYNVVYLISKKKAGTAKFKDVSKNLKAFLAQQKTNEWVQKKLQELAKKATIK